MMSLVADPDLEIRGTAPLGGEGAGDQRRCRKKSFSRHLGFDPM